MYILFTILIVIASVLLILLVLVQNSKGGGLAAGFSSSNQIMGVRKTTDFLEKATWLLVSIVIVLSVATVGVHKKDVAGVESEIKNQYQSAKQAEPGVVAPGFGENPEAAKKEEAKK
jgi:preprotein translocase subunit SecG